LGFDPTIERVPGESAQFIITVHPHNDKKNPRRFLTKKILSSYGAEPLRGRGTRVFEAIEIDEHGREKGSAVVLKDIWIDHDRAREGAILAQMLEAADEDTKKLLEKHFLTTVCHGDVLDEAGCYDDTEKGLMRGLKVTESTDGFELQQKQLVVSKHEAAPGSQGLRATSRLHVPHPSLKYAHKIHYRIVFEEICITIDLILTHPEVMKILTETVTGVLSSDFTTVNLTFSPRSFTTSAKIRMGTS
jgi:Fungal protein kinase